MDATDRSELKHFPRIRPIATAAAAFSGTVPKQKPMAKREGRTSDCEVQDVFAGSDRVSRPPAEREVFDLV